MLRDLALQSHIASMSAAGGGSITTSRALLMYQQQQWQACVMCTCTIAKRVLAVTDPLKGGRGVLGVAGTSVDAFYVLLVGLLQHSNKKSSRL